MTEMNKLTFALYGTAVVEVESQWKRRNKPEHADMSDERADMAISVRSTFLGTLIRKRARGLFGYTWATFVEQRVKLSCHVEGQRGRSRTQSLGLRVATLLRQC